MVETGGMQAAVGGVVGSLIAFACGVALLVTLVASIVLVAVGTAIDRPPEQNIGGVVCADQKTR